MTTVILFAASFASTFLGAYQIRNIAGGHVVMAFFTSLIYSAVFATLYKLMPDADWLDIIAYAVGTSFGVVSSMKLHIRMHGGENGKARKKTQTSRKAE